jgi:hypothetical protein
MEEKMSSVKKRYFHEPPLANADMVCDHRTRGKSVESPEALGKSFYTRRKKDTNKRGTAQQGDFEMKGDALVKYWGTRQQWLCPQALPLSGIVPVVGASA